MGSAPLWSLWFIWSVSFVWSIWLVWFNQTNKTNQTNQINETDEIATSRGEVGIMPQDMVASPYNPKRLLLKMPYRFNKGYRLLVCNCLSALCDCSLSLDFRRSRP
jgi:hypothetical protein